MLPQDYPWPLGKAPWSRENGGNGIAATGVRENWENDDFEDILRGGNEVEIELKNILSVGGAGGLLPSVESLKEPSNKEDAIKMLLLSEKMYRLGIEFFGNKINRVESETLGAVYKALTSTW